MALAKEEDDYVYDSINSLLPDSPALPSIPLLLLLLSQSISQSRTQATQLQASLAEKSSPSNSEQQMSKIQTEIGQLLELTNKLVGGSKESQEVVKEITEEISTLDKAKSNLTESMRGLKRFQMLVNAFDQLTRLAKAKRYRETASSLLAVKGLAATFSSFQSVERISALSRGIQSVQGVLRAQIFREFETAITEPGRLTPATKNQLVDACPVIDALGEDSRKGLLDWYIAFQLREYRRIFRPEDEAGQLDNLPRRYAWFRRVLKSHEEENESVFPSEWKVTEGLVRGFADSTKEDLRSVLARSSANPPPGPPFQPLTVTSLLEAIQTTADFQREMCKKFKTKTFAEVKSISDLVIEGGTIESVFESYLVIFVDAQDKKLADMMQTFKTPKLATQSESTSIDSLVLPSSTEVFYFYGETLESLAKLTNKLPFLDLCGVFKKWLKTYAEDILVATYLNKQDRKSSEGRPNVEVLQNACQVINTADYCLLTSSQLEERLKERIHPDLQLKVSLESEKEVFLSTISSALLVLLRELEFTVEPVFSIMAKSPWKDVELVSSESSYVADFNKGMYAVIDVVRDGLQAKKYFRSFCDKAVGVLCTKFTQTMVRCRPINQIGAEQMLLDIQSLKNSFLQFPQTQEDDSNIPLSYTRYVNKSVGRIDTILKAIMSPETPPEAFVGNYLTLIPCQSFSDFQKILDLKGVKKAEQNNLLDVFLSKTSVLPDLSDSSFLSSLDMDPNAYQAVASSTGTNTPVPTATTTSIFGLTTLPLPTGSRDTSRVPSPNLPKPAETDGGVAGFKRFMGQRIGSRLFTRDASGEHK
ncbi:hypothetical protein BT69DRAFT_1320210 [Atractiella rhizophila]|nr:hypothetical protein BT69DRAFT_1320210 [Atractiella rhizophila]